MAKNSLETLQKRKIKRAEFRETVDFQTISKYKVKICKDCAFKKPCRWMRSFTAGGEPEYRNRCDDCYRFYQRTNSKKTRKNLNFLVRRRIRGRKIKCIQYLGGKCIRCGYCLSPRALTFHHRDRDQKEFSISQIKDRRWELIQAELDKCDLLCFNCHMEEEEIHELQSDNRQASSA